MESLDPREPYGEDEEEKAYESKRNMSYDFLA